MSRYFSYLNSSTSILSAYKGESPFSGFLKTYFSRHKKFGSNDRKQVSHLCYCYFRLGKALPDLPFQERIITGLYLCSTESHELIAEIKPDWNKSISLSFEEKCLLVDKGFSLYEVFPWPEKLSLGFDYKKFCASFFIQPDLFIRLRPGFENIVKQKLKKAGIDFTLHSQTCIAVSNATKLDSIFEIDKVGVIQDLGSQHIGEYLKLIQSDLTKNKKPIKVWDCCAASGGKSIMTADILGNIELTVSDVRAPILENLKKRFRAAGIRHYKTMLADLSGSLTVPIEPFDLIIADVPCTGSGTWGRIPEQLFYFDGCKIDEYASLQQKIISNVSRYLTAGGYLLYITCSVFKKENEDMVTYIQENCKLGLLKQEVSIGYTLKADTMFAALFKKKL